MGSSQRSNEARLRGFNDGLVKIAAHAWSKSKGDATPIPAPERKDIADKFIDFQSGFIFLPSAVPRKSE